jgi:hypothetical protein
MSDWKKRGPIGRSGISVLLDVIDPMPRIREPNQVLTVPGGQGRDVRLLAFRRRRFLRLLQRRANQPNP